MRVIENMVNPGILGTKDVCFKVVAYHQALRRAGTNLFHRAGKELFMWFSNAKIVAGEYLPEEG